MNPEKKAHVFYILAIICGIWFLLFGWIWTYLANLILAYPVGILGFIFWLYARKINPENRLNRICIRLLLTALFLSLFSLFLYK